MKGWKRSYFYFIILFILSACIEPFDPDIEKYESTIVIFGELVEKDSIQKVEVSISSDFNERKYIPVSGCVVYVEDDLGNVFQYTENEFGSGTYTCHIPQEYLRVGVSYRLTVNAGDSATYMSDYDKMVECPDIDTLYHEVTQKVLEVDEGLVDGVQFFVDVKQEQNQAKYCRWSLIETWYYRAYLAANAKWEDGQVKMLDEQVHSPNCWLTKDITSIFTAQIDSKKKPVELNFVSTLTPRMYYKYSLLVRQYGINEDAYSFWSIINEQFENSADLYEKQPQGINSNITNIKNEDEIVLGFFSTASVKEKRIFIEKDSRFWIEDYCKYEKLPAIDERVDVAYLYVVPMFATYYSPDSACFDCTFRGGTSVKPDFWED